jgi:hypothetical protein
MASVPDRFIREKEIDYNGEILSSLGCGLVAGEKRLKPFTIGVLSLLEVLDNRLLKGDKDADWFDYGVIYYVNDKRKGCIEEVADYSRGLTTPLRESVEKHIKREKLSLLWMDKVSETLEHAFYGFEMLPKSGGTGKYLFGSDTIANVCFVACEKLGVTYEEAIWEVPLTLIGHTVAVNAQYNGLKGVGRRKDEDQLKYIFKKCKEWDKENKLYPWQWLEPQFYPLEPYQDSKEIKRDYKERLNEVTNAKVKR